MKLDEISNELKKALALDNVEYLKRDDIAIYFGANKGLTSIQIKYVLGRVYIKNEGNWKRIKGLIIQ